MSSPRHTDRKPPSIRRNFGWGLAGNIIYQASQWGMLIVLTKLTSPHDVGLFTLALAVCTPINAFASLQLQSVQVSDVRDEYSIRDYLGMRAITVVAAMIVIASVALGVYPGYAGWLIIVIGAAQSVLSVREVFNSYLQRHERLRPVAIAHAVIGLTSLTVMGVTLAATRDVLTACAAMAGARLLSLLVCDLPMTRGVARELDHLTGEHTVFRPRWRWGRLRRLFWRALPVGLMVTLMSLTLMAPRYMIEHQLNTEALGYFGALAALPMAGQLVMQAAGITTLPRLSRYFLENRPAFVRLMLKLAAVSVIVGVLGVLVALVAGRWLLAFVFTPDYADYHALLVWLMAYGLIDYVANLTGYGLHAARRFWAQPIMVAITLALTILGCWLLLPVMGMTGAVLAMVLARSLHIVMIVAVVTQAIVRARADERAAMAG